MGKKEREPWLPASKDTLVDIEPADTNLRSSSYAGLSDGASEVLQFVRFKDRYHRVRDLGQGGMGVVALCDDHQIGRRVAMKVLRLDRAQDEVAEERFIREARIQGRLEHPSIVPVYDLGVDPDGDVYFTMKRVQGVTLAQILDQLRQDAAAASERYGLRRLLTAFGQICLAIDYAHQQGFLHRDLKPANIMLGDYGEVYVLDWGLAGFDAHVERESIEPTTMGKARTRQGIAMGTPGYMSPEQAMGMNSELTPATDVYALGAILFELLCHIPLCEPGSPRKMMSVTVGDFEKRPSVRAPEKDVPGELEAVVVRATAISRRDRYETARDLYLEIERFLDGQRSEEERRKAASHLAREALRSLRAADRRATTEHGPSAAPRRAAMRSLGRALALDPDNVEARDALGALLHELPERLPQEVAEHRRQARIGRLRWMAQLGLLAYLSMFLYLPFLLASGIRNALPVVLFYGLSLAAGVMSVLVARAPKPSSTLVVVVALVSNIAIGCTAPFFGPLLVTPTVIAVNSTPFALYLHGYRRWIAIGSGVLVVLVTWGLSLAGWIGGGYEMREGMLIIHSGALGMHPTPTLLFLLAIALGQILTGAFSVSRLRDDLDRMEQRLYLYTWNLTALLPSRGTTQSQL